eukprot:COSAG04_NODE_897_length_9581_cov_96.260599_9_plen_81_part_00
MSQLVVARWYPFRRRKQRPPSAAGTEANTSTGCCGGPRAGERERAGGGDELGEDCAAASLWFGLLTTKTFRPKSLASRFS